MHSGGRGISQIRGYIHLEWYFSNKDKLIAKYSIVTSDFPAEPDFFIGDTAQ